MECWGFNRHHAISSMCYLRMFLQFEVCAQHGRAAELIVTLMNFHEFRRTADDADSTTRRVWISFCFKRRHCFFFHSMTKPLLHQGRSFGQIACLRNIWIRRSWFSGQFQTRNWKGLQALTDFVYNLIVVVNEK